MSCVQSRSDINKIASLLPISMLLDEIAFSCRPEYLKAKGSLPAEDPQSLQETTVRARCGLCTVGHK